MMNYSGTSLTVCRKTKILVIPFTVNVHGEPRRAACRGISLLLCLNQREIPHFVRNDKINCFFRTLVSESLFDLSGDEKSDMLNPFLLKSGAS